MIPAQAAQQVAWLSGVRQRNAQDAVRPAALGNALPRLGADFGQREREHALGGEQLERVPDDQLVFHLDERLAALPFQHARGQLPGLLERVIARKLGPAQQETGVIGAVRDGAQLRVQRIGQLRREAPLGQRVQSPAVRPHDGRDVVLVLHAPLDLERIDPRLAQRGQQAHQVHVAGAEYPRAALDVLNRQMQARALLLLERVLPAAGLGAVAAVRIPPGKVPAQRAAARIGHAHRTVDEHLELERTRRILPQCPDLRKGQLAREHDALHPAAMPEPGRGAVHRVRLGGQVHRQAGNPMQHLVHRARIGHDHAVRRGLLRQPGRLHHRGHVLFIGEDIQRHIDFHAARMGVFDRLAQLLGRKVSGVSAQPVARQAQVHRVRTVAHGGFQLRHAPRWGQQFRNMHKKRSLYPLLFPPIVPHAARLGKTRRMMCVFLHGNGK